MSGPFHNKEQKQMGKSTNSFCKVIQSANIPCGSGRDTEEHMLKQ